MIEQSRQELNFVIILNQLPKMKERKRCKKCRTLKYNLVSGFCVKCYFKELNKIYQPPKNEK